MAFDDAKLVAEHAAEKRAEGAREKLLKKGYSGKFRVPGNNASEHQEFFEEHPEKLCKAMGAEYRGESHGLYTIQGLRSNV